MTSVGETLRAERLKRKLGLDQISGELKISSRFLEAIETGQFDKLPGGVFTKSFVRQYARLLGLDDEDLAGQVQSVLEPPPAAPQFAEKRPLVVSEYHVPKMESWESVRENRFRWTSPLSAAALFVVALLICSGVYAWMQRPRSLETAKGAPAASVPAVSTPAVFTPATPSVVAAAPVTAAPSPTPESKSTAANPNAAVRIAITADEPVWVRARADGKFAFADTLHTQQSRTVEASENILLRLGNAGGVSITLNGKPVGSLGPKGQVRTVQFTSGGFQIVPAKPPGARDPL